MEVVCVFVIVKLKLSYSHLSSVVVESEIIVEIGQASKHLKEQYVPVLSLHHGLSSAMPRGDGHR